MSVKKILSAAALAGFGIAGPAFGGIYQERGGNGVLTNVAESWVGGFGTFGDEAGRTIASAVSTGTVAPDPTGLTEIRARLWTQVDADVFKFRIVDSASFKAFIANPTTNVGDPNPTLTLFNSAGVALAAVRGLPVAGGPGYEISEASTGLSFPAGEYYIAQAAYDTRTTGAPYPTPQIGIARNLTGQNIFDFSTDGVKLPIAGLTDYNLSTNNINSFNVRFSDTQALGASTFTATLNATIQLRGSDYIFVPEPAALGALGMLGVVGLRRRW